MNTPFEEQIAMDKIVLRVSLALVLFVWRTCAFQLTSTPSIATAGTRQLLCEIRRFASLDDSTSATAPSSSNNHENDISFLLTNRIPTSIDDQVRQAMESIKRATADGKHRHLIRLLLPVIGATDLDDWPGGARQMMQAADPLVERMIQGVMMSLSTDGSSDKNNNNNNQVSTFQRLLLDASDGVYAILAQAASSSRDDSCTILLPSADTIHAVQELEPQVGPNRNLLIVNPQWKRRSDFSGGLGFFGGGVRATASKVEYAERFVPTFSFTNLICQGESIRILRTYPGPWRVFVRKDGPADGSVDWMFLGSKAVVDIKPKDWEDRPESQRDGGRLFDYGQPTYLEIMDMINNSANYTPKSAAGRALTAFNFVKDTL